MNEREISINQEKYAFHFFFNSLEKFFSSCVCARARFFSLSCRFYMWNCYFRVFNTLSRTIPNHTDKMSCVIKFYAIHHVLVQSRTRIKFQLSLRALCCFVFICLYFIKFSFWNECEHNKNVTALRTRMYNVHLYRATGGKKTHTNKNDKNWTNQRDNDFLMNPSVICMAQVFFMFISLWANMCSFHFISRAHTHTLAQCVSLENTLELSSW